MKQFLIFLLFLTSFALADSARNHKHVFFAHIDGVSTLTRDLIPDEKFVKHSKADKKNSKAKEYYSVDAKLGESGEKDDRLYTHITNGEGREKLIYQGYFYERNGEKFLEEKLISMDSSGAIVEATSCDNESCRTYDQAFCSKLLKISNEDISKCKNLSEELSKIYSSENESEQRKAYESRLEKIADYRNKKFSRKVRSLWGTIDNSSSKKIKEVSKRYKNDEAFKYSSRTKRASFKEISTDLRGCGSLKKAEAFIAPNDVSKKSAVGI